MNNATGVMSGHEILETLTLYTFVLILGPRF